MNIINKSVFILLLILLLPACSTTVTKITCTKFNGTKVTRETTKTSISDSSKKIIKGISIFSMVKSLGKSLGGEILSVAAEYYIKKEELKDKREQDNKVKQIKKSSRSNNSC
jgi:hypothetical protein